MKKMILAIAAILAVGANAATKGPSWAEIFADNSLIVAAPYASALGAKGIFNACSTGTELKTLTPVKVCTDVTLVEGHGDATESHTECTKTEEKTLSLPLSGTEVRCVRYKGVGDQSVECVKWAKVPYTISLTQAVDVLRNNDQYPTVAFTKNYTIPACAQ